MAGKFEAVPEIDDALLLWYLVAHKGRALLSAANGPHRFREWGWTTTASRSVPLLVTYVGVDGGSGCLASETGTSYPDAMTIYRLTDGVLGYTA